VGSIHHPLVHGITIVIIIIILHNKETSTDTFLFLFINMDKIPSQCIESAIKKYSMKHVVSHLYVVDQSLIGGMSTVHFVTNDGRKGQKRSRMRSLTVTDERNPDCSTFRNSQVTKASFRVNVSKNAMARTARSSSSSSL
jgi:hypothetical protein